MTNKNWNRLVDRAVEVVSTLLENGETREAAEEVAALEVGEEAAHEALIITSSSRFWS